MKKWEIDFSLAWNSPSHLEPVEHKDEWKYETTVSYIYGDERIYSNMTFFYNKDGKKIRTKYHVQEYKEQTKYFVKMDKEIQETVQNNSKLICYLQELIKNQKRVTGFKEFSYDFEQKQGEFAFEGCPLDFFFVFQPMVGIKVIYIDYYPKESSYNARIKDDPKEVLGEEFTKILNKRIKEKLKTRFFF